MDFWRIAGSPKGTAGAEGARPEKRFFDPDLEQRVNINVVVPRDPAAGDLTAVDGLSGLSAEGERDGFYQAQLIRGLAVRHIESWTGVELEGGPAPPTPANVTTVMEFYR